MIYVLKGWMKSDFEGAGVITMRQGSCWLQPPRIEHTVLDYSDDCELLEIILPAEFETVELAKQRRWISASPASGRCSPGALRDDTCLCARARHRVCVGARPCAGQCRSAGAAARARH